MTTPAIRAALKRLLAVCDTDESNVLDIDPDLLLDAIVFARAALATEPVGEGPSAAELTQFLFDNFRGPIEFICDAEEEAHVMIQNHIKFAHAVLARWGRPAAPPALPPNYIDPEHQGDDLKLLEAFYGACNAEGGTADEITLRGIRAVLAARPATPAAPEPGGGRWSEGICGDGAAILFDGVMVPIEEVVRALNRTPAAPPAPEVGEAEEMAEWLRQRCGLMNPRYEGYEIDMMTRAATLLQQLSAPAPAVVPVAVDLKEKDFDAEGRCWHFMPGFPGVAPVWRLIRPVELGPFVSHIAPAHAIPLPQDGEGEPVSKPLSPDTRAVPVASEWETVWREIVRSVGVDNLLNYVANVCPGDWDLAGFSEYAQPELGKGKPLPPPQGEEGEA